MKKEGTWIIARFHSKFNTEDVVEIVKQNFHNVIVHCCDCLKVQRNFREAWRGFVIGEDKTRKPFGRSPVTTVDSAIESTGQVYEITFTFKEVETYAFFSKLAFDMRTTRRDEWANELINYLKTLPVFREIEIRYPDFEGELNLFYTDLSRRLEEGDFEGGEQRSRYRI
jgi:hypothetical protein